MNIALGFGNTEAEFEAAEEAAFAEFVSEQYKARALPYFTDEFVSDVQKWAADRTAGFLAASKKHDKSDDHPSRYSYYFADIASSACAVVMIATFMHINRRHGLSPDGWALMKNKRLFDVSTTDIR